METANVREALRILDSDPTIQVLVANILMPGISGVTLAERAAESPADLPVILISEIERPAPPGSRRYWLKKPAAMDELLALTGSFCGASTGVAK